MRMMIAFVFLVSFIVHTCYTINPCCTGKNEIIKRRCIDGSQLSGLTCPHKYIIQTESGLELDANKNLLIASSIIPPDRFCSTIMNATEMYIVCFSEEDDHTIDIYQVNAILELVSVVFLLITIAVYLQVPDLLDLQGICILHSISGLTFSFIALASNQLSTKALELKLCISFAYVIYFFMLYSFFWLNVLSFHIWRTIAKPKYLKDYFPWRLVYHVFGIGGPVILVIILVIAHSMEHSEIHPGFGVVKCWFQSTMSQFIYFYAPMAFLLCLNIIYYGWTIAVLWKDLNNSNEKKTKVMKYKVTLCLKLLLIMGILWVFELLSAAFQHSNQFVQIIWYITDCVNTLQGILIFLVLVVFRKKVVRGLASRSFCGKRLPQKWCNVADDECEDIEEELALSETQIPKT